MRRPVRWGRRRGPQAPWLGSLSGQSCDLQPLHRRVPQIRRHRRRDPGHAAVRRHPRVDAIGERLSTRDFHTFLDAFYRIASAVVLGHDGLVDKFVGDEVIGLFFGGVSGPHHAAKAIDAGLDLLARVGAADATPMGPIPMGAAVHTGEAYVGASGPIGAVDDFTALGDPVNTTARLASSAAAGELLVSTAAAEAADRALADAERRHLDVRGRQDAIDVIVLRPEVATAR